MLKNLLLLSGFSTFVVIVIIFLNIYHNYQISTLSPLTQVRTIPISPTFDNKTLDDLKKRKQISVDLNEKSSVTSPDAKKASESAVTKPTPTVTSTP